MPLTSSRLLRHALAACCVLSLAACGDSTSDSGAGTLTEIDYYNADPQNAVLPGILDECGKQAGVTIQRQAVPQGQLMSKLLLQASSRSMPDLALVDNPNLQQLAATGALVSLSGAGLSTAGLYPSIVSAGQYQARRTASRPASTAWRSTTTPTCSPRPGSRRRRPGRNCPRPPGN